MSAQRRQITEAAEAKGFTVVHLEWSPIGGMVEMSGREGGWWVEGQRGDSFETALGYSAAEVVDWINEFWPNAEGQA